MGWEQRNGQRYYYRKKREGGHVVSQYMGAGAIADLFALIDRDEYSQRRWNQIKWNMEKDEAEKLNKDQNNLSQLTRQMLRACLLVKGYHPHKGQWRKKKHDRQTRTCD